MTDIRETSDEDLIKHALKAAERESWGGDKSYAFLLHQLATRLMAANEQIQLMPEMRRTLQTARNQVVAFALDTLPADKAEAQVAYIDAVLAKRSAT